MAKTLSENGISIPKPSKNKKPASKKEVNTSLNTKNKAESSAYADLNFKVSQEFKWEFKAWAASHQMSQKAALETAFDLLKKEHE